MRLTSPFLMVLGATIGDFAAAVSTVIAVLEHGL